MQAYEVLILCNILIVFKSIKFLDMYIIYVLRII